MRAILRLIDSLSEWTGKTARWLCVLLILVMTYEVVMRYAFNAPTLWGYETSMMIGAALYSLAWAHTHRHHGHVRVDVFYTHLSPKGKALVDVIGDLLFFTPLVLIFIYASAFWTWRAWSIGEKSVETYWYPPIAPLRTVVLIGFCLFGLQGGAQLIRDIYFLIRNKPYD